MYLLENGTAETAAPATETETTATRAKIVDVSFIVKARMRYVVVAKVFEVESLAFGRVL